MTGSTHGVFLGWFDVCRLGLVQTSLGAIVVLTTSTINRVMFVELALPALLPGLHVGLYYAIQITRPRLGYGFDQGGKRTPWIIGGMAVLVLLAKSVALRHRGASATTLWVMMIIGFIVTAVVSGKYIDLFSFGRLITISVIVSVLGLVDYWLRVLWTSAGLFLLAAMLARGVRRPEP